MTTRPPAARHDTRRTSVGSYLLLALATLALIAAVLFLFGGRVSTPSPTNGCVGVQGLAC
jgi:hypothetical protein